jgi:hypothetical protein
MKIYSVDYPFEVAAAEGSTGVVYPSLKAAMTGARKEYAAQAAKEDEARRPSQEPATIEVATVIKLTRDSVCAIINSGGGRWCADSRPVGTIKWDGKKVRLRRTQAGKQ